MYGYDPKVHYLPRILVDRTRHSLTLIYPLSLVHLYNCKINPVA